MINKQKIFIQAVILNCAIAHVVTYGWSPKEQIVYQAIVEPRKQILAQAQAAYFLPIDNTFRRIYGGAGIYGAELSFQLNRKLFGWVSASGFSKTGRSLGECDKTKVMFIPLGLGLKYFLKRGVQGAYLSAGVLGTYLHTENCSPYVPRTRSNWGPGALVKLGYLFDLSKPSKRESSRWFVDVFANYLYSHIKSQPSNLVVVPHNVNLSGFMFGGSIGCRF